MRPTGHPHNHNAHPQNINTTHTKSLRDIVTLLENTPMVHPNKFLADDPDSEAINRYVQDLYCLDHKYNIF